MVMQAVSILEDETLQDGFMELPDIRGTGDSRVFGELNTGFWWESTQEDAPEVIFVHILGDFTSNNPIFLSADKGAVVLPIILYLDGTWLAKGGTHSCTPLSMTIGNLPRHVMNKSSAKRVKNSVFSLKISLCYDQMLAYIPKLKTSKQNSKRKPFMAANRELYHNILRNILRSLNECHNQGGFRATRVIL